MLRRFNSRNLRRNSVSAICILPSTILNPAALAKATHPPVSRRPIIQQYPMCNTANGNKLPVWHIGACGFVTRENNLVFLSGSLKVRDLACSLHMEAY